MDMLIYLLNLPACLVAGYIASRKHHLSVVAIFVLLPAFMFGVDVFVQGNQTTFRQIFFAFWSFLSLWGVLNYKSK